MIAKFKIPKDTKMLILTEDYITNGHWIVRKDAVKKIAAFKKYLTMKYGLYRLGIFGLTWEKEYKQENLERTVLYNLKGKWHPIEQLDSVTWKTDVKCEGTKVTYLKSQEVLSVHFQGNGFKFGMTPDYMPLMKLGECSAKGKFTMIKIEKDNKLIGAIMPRQLDDKKVK